MPTTEILKQILFEGRQAKDRGDKFLAVFDLDSTLLDLSLRVSAIIDAFARDSEFRARFLEECKILETVEIRATDWGLEEPLARVGYVVDHGSDFFNCLQHFWAERFFSNSFLHHDSPLPGAVRYVNAMLATGADILYLTGRDVPRMWNGTAQSLKDQGFPLNEPRARLILKPHAHLDDVEFKLKVLRDLQRSYEKIWLFENEPVNLNLVARHCPDVGLVFIDSTHSRRESLQPKLIGIKHFVMDLSEFE